jgi:membrane protease YdiL (CAAX protease family)
MDPKSRNSLFVFLALTFALSAVFYARLFAGAPLQRIAPPLMWMPGLAAVVTQFAFHRTLAGMGWRPGSARYLALAVLLPLAYCLAIYVPVWLTGLGAFKSGYLERLAPMLPVVMLSSLVTALGEEIGWRGFLAPTLYRTRGFAWAGIGTGIIWGLWHVPLIVGGTYNAGTPAWFAVPCFLVSVIGMSTMLAWLRLRSGSLWTAALYHASHNVIIQVVFDGSTIDTGPTKWLTTEFGIGLTIASIVMGMYFWRRRGELPSVEARA